LEKIDKMSPFPVDNALSNLEKMTTENQIRPNLFPANILPAAPRSTSYSTLRCGSAGETTSDDDVDNEIINVTDDDDDVVLTTTDSTASADMFKVPK